jgi:hypothetical protein
MGGIELVLAEELRILANEIIAGRDMPPEHCHLTGVAAFRHEADGTENLRRKLRRAGAEAVGHKVRWDMSDRNALKPRLIGDFL